MIDLATAWRPFEPGIDTPDDMSRCAVCCWPLAESVEQGCTRGNCSMRPRPEHIYAPERAAAEIHALLSGKGL